MAAITTDERVAGSVGSRRAGFALDGPSTPVGRLLAEIWAARRVLLVLARKDFYARYRRTSLGLLWAVGLPLIQASVLAVVFSRVVHLHSVVNRTNGTLSFPVFLYAGLTAWSFFVSNMPTSATAIVDSAGLATKIYFPRALFPLLAVMTGIYPLAISTGVLAAVTLALTHHLGVEFLYVVPGGLLAVGITAGFGLTLSAIHVYFRDVRFVVQAVMSVLFYVTPVIYSIDAAPGALGRFVAFGPMAGPIELFRLATVGADHDWAVPVLGGIGWMVVTVVIGVLLQSRNDRVFVDLL